MNVVSFETAKQLKEAGFPQHAAESGQIWYNNHSAATFIGRMQLDEKERVYFYCHSLKSGRTDILMPIYEDSFFAPSATDILKELDLYEFSLCRINGKWLLEIENDEGDGRYEHISENPAEACAAAWLAKNEKA